MKAVLVIIKLYTLLTCYTISKLFNTVYIVIDYNNCLAMSLSCLPNMTIKLVKYLYYMSLNRTKLFCSSGILLGNKDIFL